jgi:amino acid transporter
MNSRKKIMILVIAIVTVFSFNYNIYADDSDECYSECLSMCSSTNNVGNCLDGCTSSRCVVDTNNVSCGNLPEFNKKIPELTSYIVTVLQVVIPIILIIMGMIDLFKGLTSQKEDEIKKGQKTLVKRLIIGSLIFFITVIVKLLINVVSDSTASETAGIIECIDCFINNKC